MRTNRLVFALEGQLDLIGFGGSATCQISHKNWAENLFNLIFDKNKLKLKNKNFYFNSF